MSRSRLLLLAGLVAVITVTLPAPPAQAIDPCDLAGPPGIPSPTKAGCEAAKGIIEKGPGVVSDPGGAVKDVLTAPVRAAGDEVMKGVTTWVGNGAVWLVGEVGKLIDETTTPRIQSPWFLRQYGTMGALAVVFALPLLLLSVLQGVMRRDGAVIARAAFLQLPLAFLLTAMAVTIVGLLLQLTDEMSSAVAASVGNDAKDFFKDTGSALGALLGPTASASAVPLFAVFLGALVAAAGAFVVWLELLVRSAAIYVAVLFLPFTFVAMIWPATARWCRRLVEILLAVIFAKFVIVAIMALAAAGLGHSRGDDAFQGILAGAALMLLAAFSPFVLLRLIPMAESAVTSTVGARGTLSGSTLASAGGPAAVMRRVMDSNWGGGGGSPHGAPAHASGGRTGGAGAGTGGARATGGVGAAGGATAGAGLVAAGAVAAAGAAGTAARSRTEGIERYGDLGGGGQGEGPAGDSSSGGGGASPPVTPAQRPPRPAPGAPPHAPAPLPGRGDREGGPSGGAG
jgi:hypothetical protein